MPGNPIVLSGHIDTVNPDYEKYLTNPFELVENGDFCYGLGSIDMKSFTAIIVDNLDQLKAMKTPIILSLTTDEETDLICITNVISTLKELNIKPFFTIVGEPTNSQINISAKGCYEYEIEIFGKTCHSSKVQDGINSIYIMSKLISFIEENQKKYKDLTSNCGIISGGNMVNRVPDYCKLNIDIRTLTDSADVFLNEIIEKLEQLKAEYVGCDYNVIKKLEILPLVPSASDTITNLASQLAVSIDNFTGGCEAGYYKNYSGEAIIFGVGDILLAHKPNEYVKKSEYYEYSDKLLQLITILDNK